MPDIRNYFGGGGGGSKPKASASTRAKRKNVVEDDDDDVVEVKPAKRRKKEEPKKENEGGEEMEASEFFSSTKKRPSRAARKEEPVVINDDDGEDEYKDEGDDDDDDGDDDDDVVMEEEKPKKSTPKRAAAKSKTTPKTSPKKPPVEEETTPKKSPAKKEPKAPASGRKKAAGDAGALAVLATIPDAALPEGTGDVGSFNFGQYMNNASSESNGTFSVPDAAENCLAGMTFVFTGNLPNLGREDGKEIVKRYGGKVTGNVSGNTTCVVLGENAGPKKISTIKTHNIKAITEEGFQMLLSKMPPDGGGGQLAQKAVKKKEEEKVKMEKEAEEISKSLEQEESKAKKASKQKSVQFDNTAPPRDASTNQLWTSKYAPRARKDICGNKSQVERLEKWLMSFSDRLSQGFPKKTNVEGGEFRAVMLSGPPGIGKTTAAHVIAKELGFDVVESNASDTRSKSLLAQTVSHRLDNTSLNGFFSDNNSTHEMKNVCLIMDEVDGMSAGDRGGVGQMAELARKTKVPIILCCNDRKLPKMRPFDRVCFDVPFRRPRAAEIRSRIMSICHREKISLDPNAIEKLWESSGSDIRQMINMISTFARNNKELKQQDAKELVNQGIKNTALKPFDITSKILGNYMWSNSPTNTFTFDQKLDMYFFDHDFVPLFIQENYINYKSEKASNTTQQLEQTALAAESISDADLVDKMIHGPQQHWSLMPVHGATSTVIPSFHAHGSFVSPSGFGGIAFPSFLGQLSKGNKYKRLLQEIHSHARLRISGDKQNLRQEYMPLLTDRLLRPLIADGADAIDDTIDFMQDYYLTKEDWDVMMEMNLGDAEKRAAKVPTQVKTAFTRKYNTGDHAVPFMKSASSLKPTKASGVTEKPDFEGAFEQDFVEEDKKEDENEDDDTVDKDKYIKAKKPKAAPKKKAAASTSKRGGRKK